MCRFLELKSKGCIKQNNKQTDLEESFVQMSMLKLFQSFKRNQIDIEIDLYNQVVSYLFPQDSSSGDKKEEELYQ